MAKPSPSSQPGSPDPSRYLDGAYGYLILRAARLLRYQFTALATAAGVPLSPEQWVILSRLSQEEGLSQQALCDRSFNDRSNLTRILSSMETHGLIKRRQDPGDGRRQLIYLTAKGLQLRERIWPEIQTTRHRVYEGLGPSHLSALEHVVATLERNILGG